MEIKNVKLNYQKIQLFNRFSSKNINYRGSHNLNRTITIPPVKFENTLIESSKNSPSSKLISRKSKFLNHFYGKNDKMPAQVLKVPRNSIKISNKALKPSQIIFPEYYKNKLCRSNLASERSNKIQIRTSSSMNNHIRNDNRLTRTASEMHKTRNNNRLKLPVKYRNIIITLNQVLD